MPGKKLKSEMPSSGTVGGAGTWFLRSMRIKLFGAFGLGFGAGLSGVWLGSAEVGTSLGQASNPLVQSTIVNGVPVLAVKMPVRVHPPSACFIHPSPIGRF